MESQILSKSYLRSLSQSVTQDEFTSKIKETIFEALKNHTIYVRFDFSVNPNQPNYEVTYSSHNQNITKKSNEHMYSIAKGSLVVIECNNISIESHFIERLKKYFQSRCLDFDYSYGSRSYKHGEVIMIPNHYLISIDYSNLLENNIQEYAEKYQTVSKEILTDDFIDDINTKLISSANEGKSDYVQKTSKAHFLIKYIKHHKLFGDIDIEAIDNTLIFTW
jgi:hypothetical protein